MCKALLGCLDLCVFTGLVFKCGSVCLRVLELV